MEKAEYRRKQERHHHQHQSTTTIENSKQQAQQTHQGAQQVADSSSMNTRPARSRANLYAVGTLKWPKQKFRASNGVFQAAKLLPQVQTPFMHNVNMFLMTSKARESGIRRALGNSVCGVPNFYLSLLKIFDV